METNVASLSPVTHLPVAVSSVNRGDCGWIEVATRGERGGGLPPQDCDTGHSARIVTQCLATRLVTLSYLPQGGPISEGHHPPEPSTLAQFTSDKGLSNVAITAPNRMHRKEALLDGDWPPNRTTNIVCMSRSHNGIQPYFLFILLLFFVL